MSNVRTLIAEGKLEAAIQVLLTLSEGTDLHNEILLQSARLHELLREERQGTQSSSTLNQQRNQITYALSHYLKEFSEEELETPVAIPTAKATTKGKTVFISYNHRDKTTAEQVKQKLLDNGLQVIIDSEAMGAGEDIRGFIETSIRNCEVTLSLVSRHSLLSAWVAMESRLTLAGEQVGQKIWLPCAIDGAFFSRGFVDEALDTVEAEIAEIQGLISKRLAKSRGIEDLQNELSRYNQLKHQLPEIVRKLRESLTVDISGANFETGMAKVLERLQAAEGA